MDEGAGVLVCPYVSPYVLSNPTAYTGTLPEHAPVLAHVLPTGQQLATSHAAGGRLVQAAAFERCGRHDTEPSAQRGRRRREVLKEQPVRYQHNNGDEQCIVETTNWLCEQVSISLPPHKHWCSCPSNAGTPLPDIAHARQGQHSS